MRLYLCSPYSHPDPAVREARFHSANRAAADLMKAGHYVFSPISHSHPVCHHIAGSALDHDFWLAQDISFLRHWAEAVIVNTIDGWQESRGIAREIEIAEEIGLPIHGVSTWRP